jgi:hypothetical protein
MALGAAKVVCGEKSSGGELRAGLVFVDGGAILATVVFRSLVRFGQRAGHI